MDTAAALAERAPETAARLLYEAMTAAWASGRRAAVDTALERATSLGVELAADLERECREQGAVGPLPLVLLQRARARAELRATGESRARQGGERVPLERLTPQERHVVRLAAAGLTNRDIDAQLFLSPRTVGYHLYNAYPKLGVSSRGELARLGVGAEEELSA